MIEEVLQTSLNPIYLPMEADDKVRKRRRAGIHMEKNGYNYKTSAGGLSMGPTTQSNLELVYQCNPSITRTGAQLERVN